MPRDQPEARQRISPVTPNNLTAKNNIRSPTNSVQSQGNDVASRWTDAIRKVLDQTNKPKQADQDKQDVFGEQLTRQLNHHPAFSYETAISDGETTTEDTSPVVAVGTYAEFRPILSSHNLRRIREKLLHSPIELMHDTWSGLTATCRFVMGGRGSLLGSIQFLLFLIVAFSILVAQMCHSLLMQAARSVYLSSTLLIPILVDTKEIQEACPHWMKQIWLCLKALFRFVDNYALFGKQFLGREWNEEGTYHFEASQDILADSQRSQRLMDLPPPSPDRNVRNRWWKSSRKHSKAIRFCHEMLQREQERKMARRRNRATTMAKSGTSDPSRNDKALTTRKRRGNSLSTESFASTVISEGGGHQCASELSEAVPSQTEGVELVRSIRTKFSDSDSPANSPMDRVSIGTLKEEVLSTGSYDTNDVDVSLSTVEEDSSFHCDPSFSPGSLYGSTNRNTVASPEKAEDMPWIDVGATIGLRLLNSENLRRAVASQDTAERIMRISKQVEEKFGTPRTPTENADPALEGREINNALRQSQSVEKMEGSNRADLDRTPVLPPSKKPKHAMWTSAAAARQVSADSVPKVLEVPLEDPKSPSIPQVQRIHDPDRRESWQEQHFATTGDGASPSRGLQNGSFRKTVSFENAWLFPSSEEKKSDSPMQSSRDLSGDPSLSAASIEVMSQGSAGSPVVEVISGLCEEEDVNEDLYGSPIESRETVGDVAWNSSVSTISTSFPTPRSPRPMLKRGVKIVLPMFPYQPNQKWKGSHGSFYQMATVKSCKRIYFRGNGPYTRMKHTNCLSITACLDKSFLRGGAFSEMTIRVLDDWPDKYMPRHSKYPIGACVATSYGIGILVGWRVEDDCHIVRSLWNRRGGGSANAYMNRASLHGVVEAAPGFKVETALGKGNVLAYVGGGPKFLRGRYFVQMKENGQRKDHVLEFNRSDIRSCHGPTFIPVIELVRESAVYQIQVDNYRAHVRQQELKQRRGFDDATWRTFSKGFDTIWASFLKAMEEDKEIDQGVSKFFSSIIEFLERLDSPPEAEIDGTDNSTTVSEYDSIGPERHVRAGRSGLWAMDDLFESFFTMGSRATALSPTNSGVEAELLEPLVEDSTDFYDETFAFIRAMMKTVSMARSAAADQPHLRLGLAVCYEVLQFIRTVVKVQRKNVSPASLAVWKRALGEIFTTFGPLKARFQRIGRGIAERMERHGKRAKVRLLKFVDILLLDDLLLFSMERGDWQVCIDRLEACLVQAAIIDEENRVHYHNTIKFAMQQLTFSNPTTKSGAAAKRNNEKMLQLARIMKILASPRRSILSLIRSNQVLELLERMLVRVFKNEPEASQMITIHAFNMNSLRQLRRLKDFTVAGNLWMPLLNAANDEFVWAVGQMPEATKEFMLPLSKLFTLCVAQFQRIYDGDLTAEWLDFLVQEEAMALVHEIDVKLILSVEAFSKDVKEVMEILPYYPSIDVDILNLMDEVDLDEFLKEASEALVDAEKLASFLRDKSTKAIERFLDYLPKMSIPVERRDLGEGWGLTCRSEDGGDLQLSDVKLKRENLVCQLLGDTFPMLGGNNEESDGTSYAPGSAYHRNAEAYASEVEFSVLDQIRELIIRAQENGAWQQGVGGVGQQPSDRYVAKVLHGLPVSTVLNTGIELWRNLEIDDDELMEICIKDVSYQIRLQQEREEGHVVVGKMRQNSSSSTDLPGLQKVTNEAPKRRFNPRVDPTVLYLEMRKLTLTLDNFHFRIEPLERKLFDPCFKGYGCLCIENMSIKLRVECKKERVVKLGNDMTVPVLQLQELAVSLENVRVAVKDTGADWLLNKTVEQFSEKITKVLQANLEEQVQQQVQNALENLNTYFVVNPELMLGLLGITMDDLDENVVWV